MDELIINQEIGIEKNIVESQKSFLETTLGKTINSAVDIGIKATLPDLIEDEVINIKDAILENGFKDGIKEVINSAINTGKSLMGIATGSFENVSQIEMAVKKGGIIDKTSDLLDIAINFARNKNLITKDVASIIKTGKNNILDTVSSKIEKTLTDQIKSIEKIEKCCESWKEGYDNRDLSKMESTLKSIEKNLEKVVPIEKVLIEARTIENLHSIVKNTGKFDLSEETIELAKKFN